MEEGDEPPKKENEKKRTLNLAMSSFADLKKNLDYFIWAKKVDYKYYFTYQEGPKFFLQISPKKNQIYIEPHRMAPFESRQPIGNNKLADLLSKNLILDIKIALSLTYISLTEGGRGCPKPKEKLDINRKIIIYCKKKNIEIYTDDIL